MRRSPFQFSSIGGSSPKLFLSMGFAVLDGPTLPIIAEGDEEPNDTYLEQLIAGARAAIKVWLTPPPLSYLLLVHILMSLISFLEFQSWRLCYCVEFNNLLRSREDGSSEYFFQINPSFWHALLPTRLFWLKLFTKWALALQGSLSDKLKIT